MQERPSLPLILALLVGALFATSYRLGTAPTGGPENTGQAGSEQNRRTAASPAPQMPSAAWKKHCGDVPEPLKPLCTALFDPAVAPPSNWREAAWLRRRPMQVLLATVADPDLSAETLRFDRGIEAIQNAALGSEYTLRGYWVPWRSGGGSSEGKESARQPEGTAGPDDEPGMMFFRDRQGKCLIVFLVGESSLFGVRRVQFLNALRYRDLLVAKAGQPLLLAGPNFSGSLSALRELLVQVAEGRTFQILSPSTTVAAAAETFRGDVEHQPEIPFRSLVHEDTTIARQFHGYARERWGIEQEDCARLAEAESFFGSASRPAATGQSGRGLLRLSFPRGIARLRAAYPEARARALLGASGTGPQDEVQLPLQLRGSGLGAENVPTFSNREIPVAQESVLLSTAAAMRQQGIRFVQVVATDVLDTIFVTAYLREANPGIRVHVWNSDLLMVRAAQRLPLEGTLAVTSHSLLSRSQVWFPRPGLGLQREMRLMSSRYEMGMYRAVRTLLDAPAGREPPQEQNRLWLTVVGSNGYWPIAVLQPESGHGLTWPDGGIGRLPLTWLTVFWVLVAAACVLGVISISAQLLSTNQWKGWGWLAGWSGRFDSCGALTGHERAAAMGRTYYALTTCLVPGCMLFVMSGPACPPNPDGSAGQTAVLWAWGIGLALAGGGALAPGAAMVLSLRAAAVRAGAGRRAGAVREPALVPSLWAAPRFGSSWLYLSLSALALAVTPIFLWIWLSELKENKHLEGYFFAYRCSDLLNGVCPAMPLLLLQSGWLVLTLVHRWRFRLQSEALLFPRLATDRLLAGLREDAERISDTLGHAVVSSRPAPWLLCGGALLWVLAFPWSDPQSLEDRLYDGLYLGLLAFLYVLVVLTWGRFLLVWAALKHVLDRLVNHPVRCAITALPGEFATTSILAGRSGFGMPKLLLGSIQLARAYVVSLAATAQDPALERTVQHLEQASGPYLDAGFGVPGPKERAEVAHVLADLHTQVAGKLGRYWAQGCSLMPGGTGKDDGKAGPDDRSPQALGDQIIALHYAHFIGNTMQQLRNMIRYVSLGFFLGLVSTLVYPFLSQRMLIWAGTAGFLVLGAPVVFAIVQMERHPLLRAGGGAGLPGGTAVRLAGYAVLPLVGIVSSHFPAVGQFLTGMLQPAMQALR